MWVPNMPFGTTSASIVIALAARGCLGDREAVMEGVEPGLEPGREPHEAFAAEPELELDRLAGPVIRHGAAGRELDRRRRPPARSRRG